jgi:tetratricopeptide (TPR) repeat protein
MLFGTNKNFTGRQEPLRTLARALLPHQSTHHQSTLITQAVQGMGGIGKTQLAVAFAHRYGRYFHGVHWINAAQPETIESEIALCGQKMAAAREAAFPQKLPDQLAWTLAAWQRGKARLIILDNLEDVGAARAWLGRLCGGPLRVLLTARRTDWPGDMDLRRLRLETFTPEESRAFLVKHLETRFPHARKESPDPEAGGGDLAIPLERDLGEEEHEMLDELAERLGHLPLALELTGRYLKRHRRKRVADYLEELDEMMTHRSMRNWREELGNPTDHDLDLMATFALSWEEVEDTTAQKLFLMAGYCAPNEPIPYELLERALQKKPRVGFWKRLKRLVTGGETLEIGQDQCDEALDHLTGLGLLEQDADAPDTGPTIHPLLAEYARALILNSQFSILDSPPSILHSLASTLATMTNEANETGLPERFQPLRPHARAVAAWAEGVELEDAGTLWNNLGAHLDDMADYAGARASYEQALRIDEAAFGPDHPNVATLVNNLGEVLRQQGDLEGARASYERALGLWREAYGEEHPQVATALNNLGGVQKAQGDLEGARASFERALGLWREAYGEEHPQVATALNNLGGVQQAQGDLEGARASFERALRIDEAAYGPDHPEVATDVNNLGSVQKAQGDLEGARASYERALGLWREAYGPGDEDAQHPQVATALNNLGGVQKAQGDLEGARASFERVLDILDKTLPPEHPYVAATTNNLGSVQKAQGDLEGARASYERALRIDEAAFGPHHPNVARDVNNLGSVQKAQGDLKGARASYERALRIFERFLPAGHPNIEIVRGNLEALG